MLRVGHVARDRNDALEVGYRSLERSRSARIDDEPPLALDECADERETETARCAGDDADGHTLCGCLGREAVACDHALVVEAQQRDHVSTSASVSILRAPKPGLPGKTGW